MKTKISKWNLKGIRKKFIDSSKQIHYENFIFSITTKKLKKIQYELKILFSLEKFCTLITANLTEKTKTIPTLIGPLFTETTKTTPAKAKGSPSHFLLF